MGVDYELHITLEEIDGKRWDNDCKRDAELIKKIATRYKELIDEKDSWLPTQLAKQCDRFPFDMDNYAKYCKKLTHSFANCVFGFHLIDDYYDSIVGFYIKDEKIIDQYYHACKTSTISLGKYNSVETTTQCVHLGDAQIPRDISSSVALKG